jgi:muramoyltetrapeptide carboxypeptidase
VVLAPRLQPGDRIEVVAASSAIPQRVRPQLARGVRALRSLGLKVRLERTLFREHLGSAGTAKEKATAINQAFGDPAVSGIIAAQGGDSASTCLPFLDTELIRNHPKVLLGISDFTAVLDGVYARTGLVTFHGNDVIWGFGRFATNYDLREFRNRLIGGSTGEVPAHGPRTTVRAGRATGKFLGGNLPTLVKLAGTPFFPRFRDAILFVEAGSVTPVECYRMFHHLRQLGVFDRLRGALVGYVPSLRRPHQRLPQMGDILLDVTRDLEFPILSVSDFGHRRPNTVLPIGVRGAIDADAQRVEILEPCVR